MNAKERVMSGLIILDRDGVINQDSDNYIKSVDEFVLLPNSVQAITALKRAGYIIGMATNQSGVTRGLYSRQTLHAMHVKLQAALAQQGAAMDWMMYSPHLHKTACRKPNTGMYHSIAWRFGVSDLADVPVVGDSWRDLEAAMAVGARPILVKTGKGMLTLSKHATDIEHYQIPVVDDLLAAVRLLGVEA
jgi:D-glycero-D-manno-heptose 1,7-bisphosphate phosphatase